MAKEKSIQKKWKTKPVMSPLDKLVQFLNGLKLQPAKKEKKRRRSASDRSKHYSAHQKPKDYESKKKKRRLMAKESRRINRRK